MQIKGVDGSFLEAIQHHRIPFSKPAHWL